MFKKGYKIYSIFKGYCPKCHEESIYSNKNPYALHETLKVNETCSKCGVKYRLEPSFFYGSMYISYGVGIIFAAISSIISFLIFGNDLKILFGLIVLTLLGFMPVIMRLSRNIWINFFIHYSKPSKS